MILGDKVREYREKRGLSISELSRETAIPESIIIKIETDPEYTNTYHGKLQARKILAYLGVENHTDAQQTDETTKFTYKSCVKIPRLTKYLVHAGLMFILFVYIYANAVYKQEKVEVYTKTPNYGHSSVNVQNGENTIQIRSITLKSSGDVWITATIDGEKTIFNIKDGETKTINFQNKIAFETIGNVNYLTIQFGEQEVSFKDKEVIHNVFVDEEGIFYNGYNVLRGKPKI